MSPVRPRRSLSLLISVALLLITAACSGDDRGSQNGSPGGEENQNSEQPGDPDAGPDASTDSELPEDPDVGTDTDLPDVPDPGEETISQRYPRDQGIGADPAVIWHEDFEQDTIELLADRYQQSRTNGMSFSSDPPPLSSGSQSVVMTAGGEFGNATDLYTTLPGDGYDQLYIRYYVRHHEDSNYHHTRANLGGYNPPSNWPQGGAGTRPNGDDRLSITVEPLSSGPERRMDFYNYWMNMRSWEAGNPPDGSAFGNTLIHDASFVAVDGQWHCLEVMARLNHDPDSAAGGELAAWWDGELVEHFTEEGPLGYWVRDKFCPSYADHSACLNFAPDEDNREQEVLDLQWRNSLDLKINYLWIQNFVSSGLGTVEYDDLVVATSRIGCQVP